jgi:hypothetical protein
MDQYGPEWTTMEMSTNGQRDTLIGFAQGGMAGKNYFFCTAQSLIF